jgi:hypothetical protein
MTATLEEANTEMRQAVRERLDNTDPSDDKLVGYTPPPLAGCKPAEECAAGVLAQAWGESCCEGQRLRGDSLLENRKHPSSVAFLQLLAEMKALHESKSADYGSEDDPLANIRQGADFVNIEAWRGCMVRIADKVQRLRTYCRTGRLVHEGVRDTLLDLSAYSLLAIVLFDDRQRDA